MSRTRKPPRKPSAKAHDAGRARRAEVNAAYHRRRMERLLAAQLAGLVRDRVVSGWTVIELIFHHLVEARYTRIAKRIVKKIKADITKNRKTENIHNISNQMRIYENAPENRKTYKTTA